MTDIAIVDDEPIICTSLALALEKEGWPTRIFHDPMLALPDLICQPPRLLILNGHMAGMHGIEFFQKFRPYSRCPIVFMSASADEIQKELAELGLSADDYIAKPCSMRQVVSTCMRLLAAAPEQR